MRPDTPAHAPVTPPPGAAVHAVREGAVPAAPTMPPPEQARISLRDLLAYADRHSPLLAVARARTGRGDAELEAADVLLQDNPELHSALGPRAGTEGVGYDVELSIEQRFEIAGERGLRIEAAEEFRDLAQLELTEVRWQVHRLVHAAYSSAIIARERMAVATAVLGFAERMREIATRRHAAGDISAIDVRLAGTELVQARQARIGAAASCQAARLTLARISGWSAAEPPEPSDPLDAPRDAAPPRRLLEVARRHNPTLRTRAQAIREADARVELAEREAWPEPALGLLYAHESEPGGGAESRVNIGLVTLGIPIPFWQQNQGEIARARTDAAVARAERGALDAELVAEIARAGDAVNAAAERVRAYGSEIIPNLEQNLALLQRAFELGELDLLELMVARGRFLDVQRDALDASGDYHAAVARLEKILGTDIWSETGGDPS